MAYEDLYDGTEIVSAGKNYWIKIKTTLTHGEKERADRQMHKIEGTLDDRGKMRGILAPDYEAYQRFMVAGAIVDWNLDEPDGTLWQLSPDSAKLRNIDRLPHVVFDRVFKRAEDLNKEDPAASREFRDSTTGIDPDGHAGTADSSEVLVGNEALGTAGDTGATSR